jgi:hypothetical protein
MKNTRIQNSIKGFIALVSVIVIFLFCNSWVYAQTPEFSWAKRAGGTGDNYGYDVTSDGSGNVIVTGRFAGTATFGTITLSSGGGYALFVAKYDASGDVLWVKQTGGSGSVKGYGIVTDVSGNIIVTGCLQGTATFDLITLTSAGSGDIFIAKYDPSGNVIWAKQHGSPGGWDEGWDVVTDGSGNSIITGYFIHEVTFESTTLISMGGNPDIFIAKYDPSGNVLWAKRYGGTGRDQGNDITIDENNNILITGLFSDWTQFGTFIMNSAGNFDIFIAKYDSVGEVIWVKRAGGSGRDEGHGIATDGLGNYFISGWFEGTATFGSITLTSTGSDDVFIAKYDSAGNVIWAKQAGGTKPPSNQNFNPMIVTDELGNSIIVGCFESTATFGNFSLTSAGGHDIFIVKNDAAGEVIWAQNAGGTGDDIGFGIVMDGFGNNFVTGIFEETATFGDIPLSSDAGNDIFIAKIIHRQISEEDRHSILLLGPDRVNTASKLRKAGHNVLSGVRGWYLDYLHDRKINHNEVIYYDQIWYMEHNYKPSKDATKYLKEHVQSGGRLFICGDNYDISSMGDSDHANNRKNMANWRDSLLKVLGAGEIKQSKVDLNSGAEHSAYNVLAFESIDTKPFNVSTIWHEPGGYGIFENRGNGKVIVSNEIGNTVAIAFRAGDLAEAPDSKVVVYLNSNNSLNWYPLAANIAHFLGTPRVTQRFKILVVGFDRVDTASKLRLHGHDVTKAALWFLYDKWVISQLSEFDQIWYVDAYNVPYLETEAKNNLIEYVEDGGHVFFAGDSYKDSYQRIDLMNWRDDFFNRLGAGGVKQSTIHKTGKMFYTDPEHSISDTLFLVREVGQESEGYGFFDSDSIGNGTKVVSDEAGTAGNPVAIAFDAGKLDSALTSKAVIFLNSNCSTNWTFLAANIAQFLGKKGSPSISKQYAQSSELTEENPEEEILPKDYEISQNYPNPFNPDTYIKYQLPKNSNVLIKIFNSLGQEIKTLVNEEKTAGYYTVHWNGTDSNNIKVGTGIYFYRMSVEQFSKTRKMLLLE